MTSPDVEVLWAELEQLAWSPERRGAVGDGLAVSDHAVLRYRERVERIPRVRARRRLQDLASGALWQDVPREWMTVVLHPGTHYGYPSGRPDVCLLEREGFVVTVMSERFLRQQERTSRARDVRGRDSRQRPDQCRAVRDWASQSPLVSEDSYEILLPLLHDVRCPG